MTIKERPIAVARCVLLDYHHRILLGLRTDTGRWECPGGKIENETVEAAAKRECQEECLILPGGFPELIHYADVRHMTKDRRSIELYLAFPEWSGEAEVVDGECHSKWAWFSIAETRSLIVMPSCEELLRFLLPQFLVRHADWPPLPSISLGPVS